MIAEDTLSPEALQSRLEGLVRDASALRNSEDRFFHEGVKAIATVEARIDTLRVLLFGQRKAA